MFENYLTGRGALAVSRRRAGWDDGVYFKAHVAAPLTLTHKAISSYDSPPKEKFWDGSLICDVRGNYLWVQWRKHEDTKFEARNSKQYQMTEILNPEH